MLATLFAVRRAAILDACAYISVVVIFVCPNTSFNIRISSPMLVASVAKEWRRSCIRIRGNSARSNAHQNALRKSVNGRVWSIGE